MPKPSLLKKSSSNICPIAGDTAFHTYNISPKGNIITRLELELSYYDFTVEQIFAKPQVIISD